MEFFHQNHLKLFLYLYLNSIFKENKNGGIKCGSDIRKIYTFLIYLLIQEIEKDLLQIITFIRHQIH